MEGRSINMDVGSLVIFKNVKSDTPGVPKSYPIGVGTMVNQPIGDGIIFRGELWADIMWSSSEVTRCFKQDLSVINDLDNLDVNPF